MTYFNQNHIDLLKDAEPHFTTVVKAQWKRGTTKEMNNKVADIYEMATGERVSQRNWGCATCVYNLYLKVGKLYFASIEYLKEQQIVAEELEPEAEVTETKKVTAKTTKKVANKKK